MNAPAAPGQIGARATRKGDYRFPGGAGRYIAFGGTAIVNALDTVVAKGRKIAARLLETTGTDIAMPATPQRVWQALQQPKAA